MLLGGIQNPEERIYTGKQLTNIVTQQQGVIAEFSDGSSYAGSIVVGADGIWSTVRDQIRQHTPEGLFLDNPYQAAYRGIFGRAPLVEGITSGQGIEVHGDGWLIQAFPSQKEIHMFIYKSIEPTTEKVRFSSNVSDKLIEEFADVRLTEKVAFKDLWDKRFAQGIANFEEGVAEMWHWDRIALVGDAAHKVCVYSRFGLLGRGGRDANAFTDIPEAGRRCQCWDGVGCLSDQQARSSPAEQSSAQHTGGL